MKNRGFVHGDLHSELGEVSPLHVANLAEPHRGKAIADLSEVEVG